MNASPLKRSLFFFMRPPLVNHKTTGLFLLSLLVSGTALSSAQAPRAKQRRQQQPPAAICPDPSEPCQTSVTFQPHDLPFRLSRKAVIWESEFFYAIILKSVRDQEQGCTSFIAEDERVKTQALFPHRKVFASRCAEPGELYYTNVKPHQQFMAVYAGRTRAEATRMLAQVKAVGKFPNANLRRMRAGFNGT